ncbi:ATP-binding protein [Sphaerisporangium sp. NPDC005288]|uniref:ATP-binding protein n=1 Tax=Sphaerisporangium rhizosphaerae TaxID=2269375 RepID=A0ABW2P3K7_9ACTN
MSGTPDGQRAAYWDIPRDPTVLADVRKMIRQTLSKWQLAGAGDDLTDDIVLASTEVLSNAVLYGLPPIRFTLRVSGETLLAEITDHGAGRPERRSGIDDDEHGRGLTIVEALCDEWGVLPSPEGPAKTVWFRKKCPPDDSTA